MVKRWCAALLCTLLTVSLTGCGSLLKREWYEVKDHSPTYYEGEGRDVLRADTYHSKLDFRDFIKELQLGFRALDKFGPDELEERQRLLFELSALIWSAPRLSVA